MSIINKPQVVKLPIVLSIPHAGTGFPEELENRFKKEFLPPDDTDWYINWLYDFAFSLGIPTITARYSRWVIDVNRSPDNTPLYNDGRMITGLCPVTDLHGNNIYNDGRTEIHHIDLQWRKELFYYTYHNALQPLLNEVKEQFGAVLLWDCHSVKRHLPYIQPQPFADFILGSVDGSSASPYLIEKALEMLGQSNYSVSHNQPFKGGYITRSFGKPEENQHALQLEIAKPLYLDEHERNYDSGKAEEVRALLTATLTTLGKEIIQRHKPDME